MTNIDTLNLVSKGSRVLITKFLMYTARIKIFLKKIYFIKKCQKFAVMFSKNLWTLWISCIPPLEYCSRDSPPELIKFQKMFKIILMTPAKNYEDYFLLFFYEFLYTEGGLVPIPAIAINRHESERLKKPESRKWLDCSFKVY